MRACRRAEPDGAKSGDSRVIRRPTSDDVEGARGLWAVVQTDERWTELAKVLPAPHLSSQSTVVLWSAEYSSTSACVCACTARENEGLTGIALCSVAVFPPSDDT